VAGEDELLRRRSADRTGHHNQMLLTHFFSLSDSRAVLSL
jgi:hypothetical protein